MLYITTTFRLQIFKNTCPPHGLAGPEALVPFHLLLGSTSLPALTFAGDRVTDVISVVPSVPCSACNVCSLSVIVLIWIIIEINLNPDDYY